MRDGLVGEREVRRQERVGELTTHDRLRHDGPLGGFDRGGGLGRDDQVLRLQFETGVDHHVALHGAGRLGDLRLFGEELDDAGVPRRGLREDRRDTVQALQLLCTLRVRERGVRLDAGTLLAHEQGDRLELRAVRRLEGAALCCGFDLTNGAGEDGDEAVVVERPGPARSRPRATGSATGT